MTTTLTPGQKVSVNVPFDSAFAQCAWFPQGIITGTIQRVFKNGSASVAVDQLRNVNDGGDGLRTLHFPAGWLS